MYDKLVSKVNATDTNKPSSSGLVTKRWYDSDKKNIEKRIEVVDKEISNTNGLIKKTVYNTDWNQEIIEIENKISSVTGLVLLLLSMQKQEKLKKINWYY